jgi:flagellar hook-length control protein FliK
VTPTTLPSFLPAVARGAAGASPRTAGNADEPADFAATLDGCVQSLAQSKGSLHGEPAVPDEPAPRADAEVMPQAQPDTLALLLASTQLAAVQTDPRKSAAPTDSPPGARITSAPGHTHADIHAAGTARPGSLPPAAVGTLVLPEPSQPIGHGALAAASGAPHSARLAALAPAALTPAAVAPAAVAPAAGAPAAGAASRGIGPGRAAEHRAARAASAAAASLSPAAPAEPSSVRDGAADSLAAAAPGAVAAGRTGAREAQPPMASGSGRRSPEASWRGTVAAAVERTSGAGTTSPPISMGPMHPTSDGPPPDDLMPAQLQIDTAGVPAAMVAAAAVPAQPQGGPSLPAMHASLGAMVGSSEWAPELASQVLQLGPDREVELHLNPAELGPLKVRLSLADHQAHIVFVSEHAAVRQALEAALPLLRTSFADNGISLGQTTVGSGTGDPRAESGAGQRGQPRREGQGRQADALELPEVGPPPAGDLLANPQHAVDTFV